MRCKVLRDMPELGWKAGWNINCNDKLASELIAKAVLERVDKRGRKVKPESASMKPASERAVMPSAEVKTRGA